MSPLVSPSAMPRSGAWAQAPSATSDRIARPEWLGLGALAVLAAFSLVLVSLADNLARANSTAAEPLFWTALLLLVGPIALYVMSDRPSSRDRTLLVALLGLALYMVKVLHSPTGFDFGDELVHLRTAEDISRFHHLFHSNPLNTISPFYPGLEIVTSTISQLTGFSLFTSGIVVIGAARLLITLSLLFTFERVSGSNRVAGLAAIIYMANPNFLFEGAQFSYESLGLPIVAFALYLGMRHVASGRRTIGLTILAVLALVAGAITHHAASYAVALLFTVWAVSSNTRLDRGKETALKGSWVLAGFAGLTALAWLGLVAPQTANYLGTDPLNGGKQVVDLVFGNGQPRQLFNSGGHAAPILERAVGFAAVVLILAVLPFALRASWTRFRRNAAARVLMMFALLYPASLALRLTQDGQETANRASEYLFAAIGFVVACWLCQTWERSGFRSARLHVTYLLTAGALLVVFAGGVVTGWAHDARLPGPYIVAGGSRSVGPQNIDAAKWLLANAGTGNRTASDRTTAALAGSLGEQRPVGAGATNDPPVWPLFFAPSVGLAQRDLIRREHLDYVIVDRRLSKDLPRDGVYILDGEPRRQLTAKDLTKFDGASGMQRVFDSGAIRIYDVRHSARGRPHR